MTRVEEILPAISCNDLDGITTPQNINIEVYSKKKKVILLIDSIIAHKFIHCKIAHDFNLFIYTTLEFQVMVVDGGTINCSEKIHNIDLSMRVYVPHSLIIFIPMGRVDVGLGVQW